jgi:hypothetical protein
MTAQNITMTEARTHWARIYVAGAGADAERVCREYCMEVGLCVTVTPTQYIYTGGQEAGVIVGLINYPRFPLLPGAIEQHAEALGMRLMVALCQLSFTVETPTRTRWFSRRQERAE